MKHDVSFPMSAICLVHGLGGVRAAPLAEISAVFSWRGAGLASMFDAYLVSSTLAADYLSSPGEAGYYCATAVLWVEVSLFPFTIPASGLLVAKVLLHTTSWLLKDSLLG